MDKIINNQGFHHIVENIFITLKHKDITSCLFINKSSNEILDDPNFWLRKWIIRGLSGKNLTDWRNAIQLSKNTKLESKMTRCLRKILKRDIFIDMPCFVDKKVVELFLNTDFVIPSPYQFRKMIISNEDMGIIQLATILRKTPNAPPKCFSFRLMETPLYCAMCMCKLDVIKILAPYETSTNIHTLVYEFTKNFNRIDNAATDALTPFMQN